MPCQGDGVGGTQTVATGQGNGGDRPRERCSVLSIFLGFFVGVESRVELVIAKRLLDKGTERVKLFPRNLCAGKGL